MAAIEHSRLSRRTVLTGAAAVFAASAVAPPAGASAEGPASSIRAAAVLGDGIVALTADREAASPYSLWHLAVDADWRVSLGERLAIDFPEGFHPHSMAARGQTLWVTGAIDELVKTITVDGGDVDVYRARPALLRLQSGRTAFADLPIPAQVRSGVATALVLPGTSAVAVAVEGCPDANLTMITRSHLAFSADDGRTWKHGPLVDGLGEGYGTVLAAVGDRLFAVTADGAGTQTSHTGTEAALEPVATARGAGRPMAAIPTADGGVSVFSASDGRVRQSRFGESGRAGESSGVECGCAGEIVAVRGRLGAWLEIDADTVRAQGL